MSCCVVFHWTPAAPWSWVRLTTCGNDSRRFQFGRTAVSIFCKSSFPTRRWSCDTKQETRQTIYSCTMQLTLSKNRSTNVTRSWRNFNNPAGQYVILITSHFCSRSLSTGISFVLILHCPFARSPTASVGENRNKKVRIIYFWRRRSHEVLRHVNNHWTMLHSSTTSLLGNALLAMFSCFSLLRCDLSFRINTLLYVWGQIEDWYYHTVEYAWIWWKLLFM